jgi:hypothetical protein
MLLDWNVAPVGPPRASRRFFLKIFLAIGAGVFVSRWPARPVQAALRTGDIPSRVALKDLKRPFGIAGIPTTSVLDRNGAVRHKILGKVDEGGLDKIIRPLL